MTIPTYAEAAEFFRANMRSNVRAFTFHFNDVEVGGVLVIDGELSSLHVQPEFRKHGIASALIKTAQAHYTHLTLVCVHDLIPFYQRFGFTVKEKYMPEGYVMEWTKG
jgi:predicted N-acetyltransferase YhbS